MAQDISIHKSRTTLLLGLIGAGIQASHTPGMHEREAAEHGLACRYKLIDLDALGLKADALPELLTDAEQSGYAGLNITHPCKQLVLPLLTDLSDDAREIGAVNTVVFKDGRRYGYNTDWLGFRQSFHSGLGSASIARVVQLGAGGGGSATAYALLKMGVGHLTVVDTDTDRCAALVERYSTIFGSNRIGASNDIAAGLTTADGLVHATPTGQFGYPGLPLPAALLHSRFWVADIVYFPLETELLRAARAAGCLTLGGSEMAVQQAVEAFRLFSGLPANPQRMHQHFVAQLHPPPNLNHNDRPER